MLITYQPHSEHTRHFPHQTRNYPINPRFQREFVRIVNFFRNRHLSRRSKKGSAIATWRRCPYKVIFSTALLSCKMCVCVAKPDDSERSRTVCRRKRAIFLSDVCLLIFQMRPPARDPVRSTLRVPSTNTGSAGDYQLFNHSGVSS